MRKFNKYIIFLLILSPMIISVVATNSMLDTKPETTFESNLIQVGSPACDWTLKELKSDVNKTFSTDFANKVVMIDFFATWCGPCIEAFPYIGEIYDSYKSNSNFVLMSISLDSASYTEQGLEDFADTHNIDWLLFHDKYRVVDAYYDIQAIPTMMIFTKTHYVYLAEEGFSGVSHLSSVVDELLAMSDSQAPVINSFDFDDTAISITDSSVTAQTDITEDFPRYLSLNFTIGENIIENEYWNPNAGTKNYPYNINPTYIWDAVQAGYENATLDLVMKDYSGHSTSDSITIDIEDIADSTSPTVSVDTVNEIDSLIGQNFKIYASFSDDTVLVERKIELWIDGSLVKEETDLTHDTGDSYYTTFFSVDVHKKLEVQIKAIGTDVSGKTSEDVFTYVVTGDAGIALPAVIGIFLLSNLIILPIYRKRRKAT